MGEAADDRGIGGRGVGALNVRNRLRKSRDRHRRGARHRARDCAGHGAGGCECRGMRHRREPTGRRGRRRAGAVHGRRDQAGGRQGDRLHAFNFRAEERRRDRQGRARSVRPHRHPRQQRRHPARRDLPQDELVRLVGRDRRASARLVQHEPRLRRALSRAQFRRVRAHDLDLGPGREFRPGQLHGGKTRDHGAIARHRARHGALQGAFELHRAFRLDPA